MFGKVETGQGRFSARGYAFAALILPSTELLLTYSVHMKSNTGGIEKNAPIREESASGHNSAVAVFAP